MWVRYVQAEKEFIFWKTMGIVHPFLNNLTIRIQHLRIEVCLIVPFYRIKADVHRLEFRNIF